MESKTARTEAAEPWLRGTERGVPAVIRAVIHALQLAQEDLEKWCGSLSDEEMNGRPDGIAPVAFHLRHVARSLDRLLTYAEAKELSEQQIAALKGEMNPEAKAADVLSEARGGIESAVMRVRAFNATRLEEPRRVGRSHLPTTVGGLLVHCADHTQRHAGQAVTTAKILMNRREK